ncbi:zinc finger BED domain-containing protein DAYSLEEPER-like [Pistacia vera]|uniref:zinc finger BED domain-containing protein DAYSLEEPER-like n=1 Tax=Pistacia vera TaxID=55513 RepID=UPI0012631AC4|nr:zinc finger BED domain-containing protein DAYSLEEPER-like [Pistacia vera]
MFRKRLNERRVSGGQQFFQPSSSCGDSQPPVLWDDKFDMARMRERAAQWVMMHDHPFTIVEEEGFNLMQKTRMPEWEKIMRITNKKDCVSVFEIEKKKLMNVLKNVNKISLMIDLWKSSNQNIEYMVITGHFIDGNWRLQKMVLSFVHIDPPHTGVQVVDSVYKCLKE